MLLIILLISSVYGNKNGTVDKPGIFNFFNRRLAVVFAKIQSVKANKV